MKILTEKDKRVFIKENQADDIKNKGEMLLKNNKVALIILAGGQGTRLGYSGPKGLFELKNFGRLFDILIERIKEKERQLSVEFDIFILTSDFTHEQTYEYFKDTKVILFKQDNEISIDFKFEPIISYSGYAIAPNGNGGLFGSIRHIDLSKHMYVNVISVDNVLADMFDPIAVGLCEKYDLDMLNKGIIKKEGESTGVFVDDGSMQIKEYSEINNNEKSISNICNHYFKVEFLEKMKKVKLEYHLALKKIPYIENGVVIKPTKENGYKKELFIFDAMNFTNKVGVLLVKREDEFSPLKNATGPDSPETCFKALERERKHLI